MSKLKFNNISKVIFTLMVVSLLAGCPLMPPQGGGQGPSGGGHHLTQN